MAILVTLGSTGGIALAAPRAGVGQDRQTLAPPAARAYSPAGPPLLPATATSSGIQFVTTATAANSAGDWTDIDNPLTNGNPNAMVFVTPNYNPGGAGSGVYNNHAIGVWYNPSSRKWSIFNQDGASAIPTGAALNVMVIPLYKAYLPALMR